MIIDYLYVVCFTVGENNIGAPKMREKYMELSNIHLFFIATCKVIALNIFCFNVGISSLIFSLYAVYYKDQYRKEAL